MEANVNSHEGNKNSDADDQAALMVSIEFYKMIRDLLRVGKLY
jgi:hypothetical protein